jgi:DNA-binding transcriptional MerR regulator/methylmalonyl-CoA mutase cobalamin-binding subunit
MGRCDVGLLRRRGFDGRSPVTPSAQIRYEIQAVSRLTGIAIDTLRAWERRYGAVTPGREAGARAYSDADVARLRLLQRAVSHGHRIGRIAALGTEALRRLVVASTRPLPASEALQPATGSSTLVEALRSFDSARVDQELVRLASVLRPIELVRDVLMPELARIGEEFRRKRASIAHEHLLSAAVRNVLGSFLRLHVPRDPAPRLLFATPAGERHELGALGAAMLAAGAGCHVSYLGPDLPARAIVDAVTTARAHVLVLGVTTSIGLQPREKELRTVARDLPQAVELWLGGAAARKLAEAVGPRAMTLSDFDEYQTHLNRIAGGVP